MFSERAALFARKVRAAREAKGLSQLKLAELSGISYRQVQLIEGNTNNARSTATTTSEQPTNPKLDTVYLLAEALEIDVSYLVDHTRDVVPAASS